MKNTMLSLLKFKCDNKDCQFECFINQNNNILIHYNANTSALLLTLGFFSTEANCAATSGAK